MDISVTPTNIMYAFIIITIAGILLVVNKFLAKDNPSMFKMACIVELIAGIIIYAVIYYTNDKSEGNQDSINEIKHASFFLLFILFAVGLHLFNTHASNGNHMKYTIMALIETILTIVVYFLTVYKSS